MPIYTAHYLNRYLRRKIRRIVLYSYNGYCEISSEKYHRKKTDTGQIRTMLYNTNENQKKKKKTDKTIFAPDNNSTSKKKKNKSLSYMSICAKDSKRLHIGNYKQYNYSKSESHNKPFYVCAAYSIV